MIPRWWRFNAVGLAGVLVQLASLTLMRQWVGLPIPAATAVAVELAILHNFFWHERWTWSTHGTPGTAGRLLRFHFANGLLSLSSNLLWMQLLTGPLAMHFLPANAISIGVTALLNFFVSERFVFRLAKE